MGIIEISKSYKLLILIESRYIFFIKTGLDTSVYFKFLILKKAGAYIPPTVIHT